MYRGLLISSGFHVAIVMVSILALPFVAKKPLDIPPLISVELIQIAEKTNIPFAPKASKIIEKAKKENEKLLSEQAPPKKVKKDEKKEVQTDKKKNEISKVASKKTPTSENKIEKLKKAGEKWDIEFEEKITDQVLVMWPNGSIKYHPVCNLVEVIENE